MIYNILISNNTILLKLSEKRKAEFWSGVADVSLPPLSDLQKRERHLSNGTGQIRAEYSCRKWHKDGVEYDGRLAPGNVMTLSASLFFGVTEETFFKCNRNASDLYQDFIFVGPAQMDLFRINNTLWSKKTLVPGLSTAHHELR